MYCEAALYNNYSVNCVCSVCIFAAYQWCKQAQHAVLPTMQCGSEQYYPLCKLQYAVLPNMQYLKSRGGSMIARTVPEIHCTRRDPDFRDEHEERR